VTRSVEQSGLFVIGRAAKFQGSRDDGCRPIARIGTPAFDAPTLPAGFFVGR
jgi:hypothetical protein